MSNPELIEDFFGVYLLYCVNPKYKGRTYIGYTRDPNRRIMQHNRGTWAGGAFRTSNKGPWKMVMIVHGFPNNISALRFEWAWQNPNKTIRLQHLNLKKIPRQETEFQFKLRILTEMLRVGPWCRLPLLIRWLDKDYYEEFSPERKPPNHMIICHGLIKSRNLKKSADCTPSNINVECLLCSKNITKSNTKLTCLNKNCNLTSHITCLADLFLTPGEYVPVEGSCPFCNINMKWGDLIRKMKGCSGLSGTGDEETDFVTENEDANENDDEYDCEEIICSQDRGFVDNNSRWLDDCDDDVSLSAAELVYCESLPYPHFVSNVKARIHTTD